ncbi:MAG: hypothetical protein AB7K24_34110 [Gemmataceae bacterium]
MVLITTVYKKLDLGEIGPMLCPRCHAETPHAAVLNYANHGLYWKFTYIAKREYQVHCLKCGQTAEPSPADCAPLEKRANELIPVWERRGLAMLIGGMFGMGVLFFLFLMAILAVGALVGSSQDHARRLGPLVEAVDMIKEFRTDRKAAEARYLGKTVTVFGEFEKLDGTTIYLQDTDSQFGQKPGRVACKFGRAWGSELKRVKPKSGLVVRGTCISADGGEIVIDDCTIVEKKPTLDVLKQTWPDGPKDR